ncbi:hypothetical protein NM688_g4760 [Phlebia brevispora]|uniref:Uncharacterized protein n=1 Tax=Phlebia brevispora TaxID=194682 RepID=A0ACC1T1R4_9APHY|nr:hypothetical protein NM688_g4760 [Phlebia brevispora]
MHLPFTPNHVQLISACYPPNAALVTAGPEYRPNSQELSRMTYYASNRPGKIHKLASELEKRVRLDCRKAKAGNIRARASLLITLAIIKALATECRRDIALLSSALLASVNATLSSLSTDLEVAARAGSVFTAWTTYTDGHLIGVDQHVTQEYMSCLEIFSHMGKVDGEDAEVRNRTRLVGLAALTGVVTSEALYHSSTQLRAQVTTFVPAIVRPLLEVEVETLDHEAVEIKEQPSSPYLSEFRNRPAMERRALSIHLHVTGDTGPSSRDVANASMRALSTLFGHSNGMQAGVSLQATFDCFNDLHAWTKIEHCRWVAVRAAEWTQYQYRYAIPTKLVECLVQDPDVPESAPRRSTLAAMVTSVFTSPIPLINLSTSDIISSLISMVLRRISKDPDDSLLPALVQSISSLGTHVYYADQIQDLAGELISRLVIVETGGVLVSGDDGHGRARVQAVRCLLAGLLGLLHAAEMHDDGEDGRPTHRSGLSGNFSDPSPAALPHPDAHIKPLHTDGHVKPSRRTSVTPEVWQDTLTLLCDGEYAIRADYALVLTSYLEKEIPKLGDYTDPDGVKRVRLAEEGPTHQATVNLSIAHGDSITRFLNALHAHIYILATSSKLGFSNASTPSPQRSVNDAASTIAGEESIPHEQQDMADEARSQSRRSIAMPRTRKMSVMKRLLRTTPIKIIFADGDTCDAVRLRKCCCDPPSCARAHANTGTIDRDPIGVHRKRAIRELIARTWAVIGRVWDSPEICQLVEKCRPTETRCELPEIHEMKAGSFQPPEEARIFNDVQESSSEDDLALDSQGLLTSIVSNKTVQDATGLDQQALLRRFTASWSAESAFKDSVEEQASGSDLRSDGLSPLVKVTPALMHIENLSRASLARSTRGVGVTDLREALEGRSSLSNPNLANTAASLSTLEHSSIAQGEQYKLTPVRSRPQRNKLAGPAEVKDVLNKLGIGKATTGGMLKPSFTARKPEQRIPSNLVPPYKT